MARMLSVTREKISRPGPGVRKKTLPGASKFKFGPLSLSVITICLIGFLALFYIIGTSLTSNKGFEVYKLEQKAEQLKHENKSLEIKASKLRSLEHLESSLNKGDDVFIPVRAVSAVKITPEEVAVIGP